MNRPQSTLTWTITALIGGVSLSILIAIFVVTIDEHGLFVGLLLSFWIVVFAVPTTVSLYSRLLSG